MSEVSEWVILTPYLALVPVPVRGASDVGLAAVSGVSLFVAALLYARQVLEIEELRSPGTFGCKGRIEVTFD